MARGRLRSGFTTRASCLFAAGLTAVVCGIALGEVNLLRAGVLAAVIPWIASWAVTRTRMRIGSQRAVTPDTVVAGDTVTVALTVTNGSPLRTATLMLEDRLPDRLHGNARFVLPPLRGRESRVVRYRVPSLARGRYRVGPLQIRLTDPFGLVEVTRAFTTTSEFTATPAVEPLGAAALSRADDIGAAGNSHSIGSQGADDASTREYRVGDDLRKIHWRSTARTGVVMVRQEERPWQGEASLLLDLRAAAHAAVPADATEGDPRLDSTLEWAISAAASFGVEALRTGRRFSLIDEPHRRLPWSIDSRESLLLHLAGVQPHPGRSLDPLLAQVRAGAQLSSTIAVLGDLDAAALTQLVAATPRGRERVPAALLIDTGSWSGADAAPAGTPSATAAAGALFNAGWRVSVVRRGDLVSDAWLRAQGRAAGVPA